MNLKNTWASRVLAGSLSLGMLGCGSGPPPPEPPPPQPSYTQSAALTDDVNINYGATFVDMSNPVRKIAHDRGVQFSDLTIPSSPYTETLGPLEKGKYTFTLTNTAGLATLTNTAEVPNYMPEYTCSLDPINIKDKYENSQVNLDLEGCLTDKNPEDRPVNVTGVELLTGDLLLDNVGNLVLTKAVENTEGESTFRVHYENANGDTGQTDFSVTTKKIQYRMAFWRAFGSASTSFIYSANIDGSESRQLTTDNNLDRWANWSPDGEQAAFTTNRNSGKLEVFVMDANGTGQHSVTGELESAYQGAFSSDGKKLAVGYVDSGKTGIAVINLADGEITKLFEDSHVINFEAGSPKWFNDKIIFETGRDGNFEIYEMSAIKGASQTNLTNHPSNDFHGAFSPNGDEMVFSSDRDTGNINESDLWVLDRITGNVRKLTSMPRIEAEPDWFFDNILFTGKATGIFQIYIIKSDGSILTQITTNPNEENGDPAFRPNNPEIVIP